MDSFCQICNMGLNPLQRKWEACEKCFEKNTIYYCKQDAQIHLNLSGCIKDHITRLVSYYAANVTQKNQCQTGKTNGNGTLDRNSLDNKSCMTCRVDILYFVCMCTYITQIYVSIFSTNTHVSLSSTLPQQVHNNACVRPLPLSHAPFKLVS